MNDNNSAPDVAEEAMKGLPVVDQVVIETLRELGSRSGTDLLAELALLFLNGTPMRVAAIHDSMAAGDAKAVEKAAHSFYSAAGNLGAKRLAVLCERIERCGKNSTIDRARAYVARLDDEARLAIEQLQFLARKKEPAV